MEKPPAATVNPAPTTTVRSEDSAHAPDPGGPAPSPAAPRDSGPLRKLGGALADTGTLATGRAFFVARLRALRSILVPLRQRLRKRLVRVSSRAIGPRALQLSIATRLAISFVAVAALVVAANLIVDGTVSSIVRTTEVLPAAPVAAPSAPPPPPPAVVVPAARDVPPSASAPLAPLPTDTAVIRSLDQADRALQGRLETDSEPASARFATQLRELRSALADYSAAVAAVGTTPPVRSTTIVSTYEQHGNELIALADARRTLLRDYSARFEELNTLAKQSLEHAWKIFGRVVARQSLMELTERLDELRRRYTEFISASSADTPAYEKLASSEAALAQTLAKDAEGFTKAYGAGWYGQSRQDLDALSAVRGRLQATDRERILAQARLEDDSKSLTQLLARMDLAAKRVRKEQLAAQKKALPGASPDGAPQSAASLVAGTSTPKALTRATADATPSLTANIADRSNSIASASSASDSVIDFNGLVSKPTASADRTALAAAPAHGQTQTTEIKPQDPHRRNMVAWLSAGVLLLVVYISAGTVLSIVRPVRRLLKATDSVAKGNTHVRVPRGGVRELDTLALAFNQMAEQLTAAQAVARGHQQILEAKVAERTKQLQDLAERDPLTGLVNRRQLFVKLDGALEAAGAERRYVGIYFLDIDNFKNLNDSLGHAFGDRVLQAISQRLAEAAEGFGFAARLGGDEFTVVYENAASVDEIRDAGLELVHAFQQPLRVEEREVIASISVGASVFPDHEQTSEALLQAADAALFQAKVLGRARLAVFTPELLHAAAVKFSTEQGLRRAIERNEFELVFQPEVNLSTGETELAEALLRWRMPDGRLATPGEFLGVAEDSGLIMQISDWVLRKAIETVGRWHHGAWPEARVAINVSPRQLFDSTFVERVKALLVEFDVPPRCVEIELTETVMQTGQSTIDALHRLKAHGIAIALDDFGTGFSSLASLEHLPLSRIKLDRSLVASIDNSPRSAAIAHAIIGLCHSLELVITAEGIERPEQLACFTGEGDLYVQGYLISHPLSAQDLIPALRRIPERTRDLMHSNVVRLSEARLAQRSLTGTG